LRQDKLPAVHFQERQAVFSIGIVDVRRDSHHATGDLSPYLLNLLTTATPTAKGRMSEVSMKGRGWIFGLVALALIAGAYFWNKQSNESRGDAIPVVAITQIATHPALDEVRTGIISGLAKRGYVDGKNVKIIFRNANGDPALTSSIAGDFVRRNVTVIVPISTPSALAVAQSTKTIPIVFSGVTDPIGVGLVKDLAAPGGNITGVSDRWPFKLQVGEFMEAFPVRKRIGMLYTRGDDVSKIGVESMAALSKELGFELVLRPVSSADDIYPTAVSLLSQTDAIYTGIDHLILENMSGLVKAANEANKPLFGGESGSVELGGVLAVTINMTEFGQITGELVADVLDGAKPASLAIKTVSNGDLYVNRAAAIRFGLNVEALQKGGARIFEPGASK
jgi:putative tryptophan/tyrosine transport system substrate-binding protein